MSGLNEMTISHEKTLESTWEDDIRNAIHYSAEKRTTVYIFRDELSMNCIWSDSLSQVEREGFFPYAVVINGTVSVC